MSKTNEINFWDKAIETMPRDQLRELQEERLKKIVRHVYECSPFYKRNFDAAGVHPDDIRSLDDIEKLPFATKEDYNESQQKNPPYGEMLCVPKERLVRYWTTTGTTMRPRVFGTTLQDYHNYLETAARVLGTAGVKPGWRVAVFFPHGHWIGLWGVYDAAWLKVGAQIVPVGGYSTEYRVAKVAELNIDCIIGTPTYVAYVSEVAREKGHDPKSVGIKAICIAGEPSSPSTRKVLEDTWGAKSFDFHGTTENHQYLGVDCQYQRGFHFWEDLMITEIVDPLTGRRVKEGESGELVYTNLVMEAMPAIRFRSGDITSLETEVCSCGRTHNRAMYILGRTEHVAKVKGLNVYPRMCEEVIRSFSEVGSEFRIVFTREGALDEVTFQIEPMPGFPKDKIPDLIKRINDKSKEVLGLRPSRIESLEYGTLEKSELKGKRVVDRRDIYAR